MNTTPQRGWLADFLMLAAIWGASFMFMRLAAMELGALTTAAMRVAIAAGKFHGVANSDTPTGSRDTSNQFAPDGARR